MNSIKYKAQYSLALVGPNRSQSKQLESNASFLATSRNPNSLVSCFILYVRYFVENIDVILVMYF